MALVHRFEVIDSTNTYAKQIAQQGAEHGTAVLAQSQTGGRGRLGRSFHSPVGCGIYLSLILRPQCEASQLMHLTCAVGVAVCDAVEEVTGFRPGIKWTNDLVWGKRKLGGILTELGFEHGRISYAVAGIGLNCTQSQEDFPPEIRHMAASLTCATGKPLSIPQLEDAMIRHIRAMADTLLTDQGNWMERYRADCITIGQQICVVRGDELRYGTALSVDHDGGLVVQYSEGFIETVTSGEVSVRGMYGYV